MFIFWLKQMACEILVPQPGFKPMPPELEVWSLTHWTIREVPEFSVTFKYFKVLGLVSVL